MHVFRDKPDNGTCLLILIICILQQEFEELTFEAAVKSAKIVKFIACYTVVYLFATTKQHENVAVIIIVIMSPSDQLLYLMLPDSQTYLHTIIYHATLGLGALEHWVWEA